TQCWPTAHCARRHRLSCPTRRSSDLYEALELLVAGDKVGFAVDFGHGARSFVGGQPGADEAFCGDASGFFGGSGSAGFLQNFDSGIEIAIGFLESFFAVHHTRAGNFSKLFNLLCSNRHNSLLLTKACVAKKGSIQSKRYVGFPAKIASK